MDDICGYRMDFRSGDPCYYTPGDMEAAIHSGNFSSDFWPLYKSPQPNCPEEIEVYSSWCWIQPKYTHQHSIENYTPMYRGPRMTFIQNKIFTALTEDEIRDLVPSLEVCLRDPWDKLGNGDDFSSVLPDMIRLVRAVEARYGIHE